MSCDISLHCACVHNNKMASNFLMAGRLSVLYIAYEFSFIVMKMIWCRGPSRSKMQFFHAKITVIA